ncbi:hypothetical protein [Propionicimonas sp.]|uniref:hypothetical protein n=1 Tax=Propionicimonas sp. TaxID=1955623 RepID=UPI00179157BB|nr:hypothetical protein [Propionicimonas sp.]MBU3977905.1 hypothetical protein [Actinomycetota bacterium]MBA3021872.1 hypothetical protein [Propionicimonas sp.]MBU3985349.1 hypothetical protein [Actinomycetota bacterium]MBU4007404.1 hypothetical protein [Actinomycetota bacterium]MBU4065650.1 hypothetical protein [Actinomycetota bacterium]
MSNSQLITQQTHPPILDRLRPLDRAALRLGLVLIHFARSSAERRRLRRARALQTSELERSLDRLRTEQARHLLHFRQGL